MGHREGSLTQPCSGLGTPANLLGHEHSTFLFSILQRALGPQAPSCWHGLTHLKLMQTSSEGQFSFARQPTLHTPALQTWLAGHCWLEMQEIMHMLSEHCSPTRQSVWPRHANRHVPA